MSTNTRRILISCAALLLVACACTAVLGLGGVGLALRARSLPPTATPTPLALTPQALVRPSATPAPTQPGQPSATPTAALPPAVAAQMDQIQQQVIAIRGLELYHPVARAILSEAQLRQHVLDNFLQDYTAADAQKDAAVLAAFGFLSPDYDLMSFYKDLYSEQVAGFYDDETKSMYVVGGEDFAGPERMTYAHEFTHALQDQTFDLRHGLRFSEEACKDESERCAAVQALIEGDASLVEQDWLIQDSTALDREQIQQFYRSYSSPVYDAAPEFFKQDFLFPYTQGMEFVQALLDRGGENAVNHAFLDPPLTTAQILHPEKYPEVKPTRVSLPDLGLALGSGWSELDSDELGEWYTYLLLSAGEDAAARLDEPAARQAAAGWSGDAYAVYGRASDGATALALSTAWETPKDAAEFAAAFGRYARARWGRPVDASAAHLRWQADGSYIALDSVGSTTLWVAAPDAATAQALLAAIQAP